MTSCLFASDLHGRTDRYDKLIGAALATPPVGLFLGGDLLPHASASGFVEAELGPRFRGLRERLGARAPRVFLILGNDDRQAEEPGLFAGEAAGLWEYVHARRVEFGTLTVYGYNCVPPTPFRLKDWERYDVSRYVDPGSLAPEEGVRSVPSGERKVRPATIADELMSLVGTDDLERAILMLHSPPYDTTLDRAALDGKQVDHAPLDVHVGSIAIRRLIEARQPRVTLHGHIHESARLTGAWRERIGRTWCLGAAHDGPELALVRFDAEAPGGATRELL